MKHNGALAISICCPPLTTPLQGVTDQTGREDLLSHLKRMLLVRIGRELGCTKVLTGDTASMMAIRVIAETAKVSEGRC